MVLNRAFAKGKVESSTEPCMLHGRPPPHRNAPALCVSAAQLQHMRFLQKLKRFLFPTRYRLRRLTAEIEDVRTEFRQALSLAEVKCGTSLPPIPPRHLQVRVAGTYTPGFFLHGRNIVLELNGLLGTCGRALFDCDRILDFGCGCGRVMIPFSVMADPAKISGTDIDPEAVAWLRSNFSVFGDLDVNGHAPPTKYETGTFDFVFGISIFTHLPEDLQHAWLAELSRIIRPGGHGVFTVHGENHFAHLPAQDRARLSEKGFCHSDLGDTEGLPDFYRASFQTGDYIRREWARHFEVMGIHEKGICQSQDAVVVRRRAA